MYHNDIFNRMRLVPKDKDKHEIALSDIEDDDDKARRSRLEKENGKQIKLGNAHPGSFINYSMNQ